MFLVNFGSFLPFQGYQPYAIFSIIFSFPKADFKIVKRNSDTHFNFRCYGSKIYRIFLRYCGRGRYSSSGLRRLVTFVRPRESENGERRNFPMDGESVSARRGLEWKGFLTSAGSCRSRMCRNLAYVFTAFS